MNVFMSVCMWYGHAIRILIIEKLLLQELTPELTSYEIKSMTHTSIFPLF